MTWKRTRINLSIWTAPAAAYRIVETLEVDGRPFTLQPLTDDGEEPTAFSTLREAQGHAELLSDLATVRAENRRLQAALDGRAASLPADVAQVAPTARPEVTALASQLNTVMAEKSVISGNDIAPAPTLVYAGGEETIPF
jgi:hypothetical protein